MRRSFSLAGIALCLAIAAACSGGSPSPSTETRSSPASAVSARPEQRPSAADPAAVGANELGMVPVLMYHRLVEDPAGVYQRTPEAFRSELERLAREGYVPVTAAEYVTGRIDIPPGKHPVVLTFDDSTTDQLAFGPPGKPKPDTAVGILLSVAREHPGFRPVATFFVNRAPFAMPNGGKRALTWLHAHGFEIGNHTYDHVNLAELSATGVQRQIAKLHRMITSAVPDAQVTTMAPFGGVRPTEPRLALHGSWHGIEYDYAGVFLVGASPAPSPYSADFDPLGIPRIRSQANEGPGAKYSSTRWLNFLEKHPARRYTSDGDPTRISFPKEKADQLAGDLKGRDSKTNPY